MFSGTRKACPITSNLFLAIHDTASPVSSKEKVHSVVYTLRDHFPHHVLIFSLLIKLLKRIHWGSPCQAYCTPPPLLIPPPHGDNTRKQPAEAYLGNKRALSGVSFSHPELQNMASYPHCYQAAYNTLTWDNVSQRMRACACMTWLMDRFTHIN